MKNVPVNTLNMLTPWFLTFFACAIYLRNTTVNASPPNQNKGLGVKFSWKYIDYDFESGEERNEAIRSGRYNHTTNAPIDVDSWRDRVFVTVIRDEGVPSSLNTVSEKQGEGGPLLQPYPNWNWTKTDCSGIVSVYRVAIDECNRLWVLDTGVIGSNRVCPPQLLTFDLFTSELIERVVIPENVAVNSTSGRGLLVTPVVQAFGPYCEQTNVYMADVEGYGLVVYNGKTFQRFTSSALVADPRYSRYTINDESFELEDGPVGMAMSQLRAELYFSPMSSLNMVSIDTEALLRPQSGDVSFTEYRDVLTTQSSAKAMTTTGTLFLGLVNNTAIGCWHQFKPLTKENIIVISHNVETLQFVSGLKVKMMYSWPGTEKLLALSNRFQKIASGTLNFTEVNYRILEGDVSDLIQNTACAPPSVTDILY